MTPNFTKSYEFIFYQKVNNEGYVSLEEIKKEIILANIQELQEIFNLGDGESLYQQSITVYMDKALTLCDYIELIYNDKRYILQSGMRYKIDTISKNVGYCKYIFTLKEGGD